MSECGVVSLHGANEPDVALVDEFHQRHAGSTVWLADTHHQPEIGRHHALLGAAAVLKLALELHGRQP